MIGEVGDELDGIELGTSVGSSLDDLEGEDDRESGDICGAAVNGPDADATGDFDGVLTGDTDGVLTGDTDGVLTGDTDRDAVGDVDEDSVGFEEGLTGACVGAVVAALTSPRERNAVSILP